MGPQGAEKLIGDNIGLSSIQPNELKLSPSGKPLIIQRNASKGFPLLYMAIAISGSEWLIGQINTSYLWNEDANFNLPPGTELCIIGESGTVLAATIAEPAKLIKAITVEGRRDRFSNFTWEDGKEAYYASAHELFVESSFSGVLWTVVLNRPQKSILAAVRSFRNNLLIMNLCTNAYHAMMASQAGTIEVSLSPERIMTPGNA